MSMYLVATVPSLGCVDVFLVRKLVIFILVHLFNYPRITSKQKVNLASNNLYNWLVDKDW